MADRASPRRVHYGWIVAGTGTLCVFGCLGLGRFALGMLLPSMASSVGLSYAQSGYIGTANFLGYLVAVLLCGHVAARTGARALVVVALVAIAGSMLLIARASSFGAILVLYAVTGLGSGAANVPVMGLVAGWFEPGVRARAAGFVVIGSGFAIVASGQLIPYVNRVVGAEGWRTSWTILGVTVGVIACVALPLLRNRPATARAAMVAAVSEHVDRDRTLAAFGFITFMFGLRQISGPAVAGVFAQRTGSFSSSFFLAAALAAAAILLAWRLPRPGGEPAPAAAPVAAAEP